MSCDVGEVTERLENELCFTYITAHSPTLLLLHLRHSSFSNPSFASPTSQALHLIRLASRPCGSTNLYGDRHGFEVYFFLFTHVYYINTIWLVFCVSTDFLTFTTSAPDLNNAHFYIFLHTTPHFTLHFSQFLLLKLGILSLCLSEILPDTI